ncbi:efflux transporter outer membrane subunit [Caulobacter sp. S45]|uniref:efflux transporter outer membrane subunit n=1 Tax=Caulobacter sp. S45 TaxID=1641861 RepID=UPI00131C1B18|nr:efflux transporter outer membrane subunit [Caulobacter sp. S45]
MRKAFPLPLLASGLLASLLSGCNLAPPYVPPTTAAPTEAYSDVGPWTPAAPADATPRGRWWNVIEDSQLDTLEDRIDHDNFTLAAALARYDQAVALSKRASASLLPEIDLGGTAEHAHYPSLPEHDFTLGASAGYELDLWGRVRNMVSASQSEAQASAADLASIRLSLQGQLADAYLNLRGFDAQIDVLRQTIDDYTQALTLTSQRYEGGASSELDVGRAKTQLGDVQAQFEQTVANRALLEHAIAVLVGESASRFSIAEQKDQLAPPHVPVEAPSSLLQRRPDIASAERRVAEANANIGVFRAALYPTVTLAGAGGYESIGSALHAAAGYWAVGPASVSLPLFDGGRRHADVVRARAVFAETSANYRQTVLDAFQQVEDQLTLANRLASAEARQQEAVDAAVQTDGLATRRYVEGASDYLEVVTAQTAELQARQADIQIRTQRLVASIDLVRALGGGWTTAELQPHPKVAKSGMAKPAS